MHPHHEHRQHKVEHSRVAKMTKGYASGGAVAANMGEGKKVTKKASKERDAMAVMGKPAKERADRPRRAAGGKVRAKKRDDGGAVNQQQNQESGNQAAYSSAIKQMNSPYSQQNQQMSPGNSQVNKSMMEEAGKSKRGGRITHRAKGGAVKGKHKGVNVNVIVAPQGGHPGMGAMPAGGMPPPSPAGLPPPPIPGARPAAPPMPPGMPGAMPPPGIAGPGMPPPGMPHRSGGRTYAKGGAVKDGPAWKEGLKSGTQVQHSNNKSDGENVGRGRVVTFRTGGAVSSKAKGQMGPKLPGGAGGGEARLFKEHRAAKNYKRA